VTEKLTLSMRLLIRKQKQDQVSITTMRRALNDIARIKIMDSVSAIHMRAIATATLKVTPRPVA